MTKSESRPLRSGPRRARARGSSAGLREQYMKIGQLAKATGTQVETIRFYEREGLLSESARTDGNYRLYSDAHVDRLAFIRRCRLMGIPLDEVHMLLRCRDEPQKGEDVGELLIACIERAADHVQELITLMTELKKMHVRCRCKR